MRILLFLMMMLPTASLAQELDVQQIVERANQAAYYAGRDGSADVEMIIEDNKGGTRKREFSMLRINLDEGDQKFYLYFRQPADVRKMAYLVWKNAGGNDDRWLWLPALNLKKRIAPGDKRTSFVGSDFFYEDVSGRSLAEDNHRLVEITGDQYLIESTPKDPASVEFASIRTWVDRTTFLPMKAEYLDARGKLYRRVLALKVETIDGYPTVLEALAEDLVAGTRTLNRFSNLKYDRDLKENIFSERFLRRPPRELSR